MRDYRTLHPAVAELVELALSSSTQAIAASGSPRFKELADKACDLFERFPMQDQVGVCALILGMLWAAMDGELATEFEQEHKMILGMRDRRAIFDALAEAIYTEAVQFGAHPDCPQPTKGRVM